MVAHHKVLAPNAEQNPHPSLKDGRIVGWPPGGSGNRLVKWVGLTAVLYGIDYLYRGPSGNVQDGATWLAFIPSSFILPVPSGVELDYL